VLVVGLTAPEVAHIRSSLRQHADVHLCPTVAEAQRWLSARTLPPTAAIVAASDDDHVSTARFVSGLVSGPAPLPTIGFSSGRAEERRDALALIHAGVHTVVFADLDHAATSVRHLVEEATHACAGQQLLKRLSPLVAPDVHHVLLFALHYPERCPRVGALARGLGVHRRTLVNLCHRSGLPAPEILLTWCRVMVAAYLLITTRITVEQIANSLDFPSANAMRNLFNRRMGATPLEVRAEWDVERIIARFRGDLALGTQEVAREIRRARG
jgi:AraC-like DNA-binding protein